MPDFNNMTVVAAAQMLDHSYAHSDLDLLELEWSIQGRCRTSSKSARLSDLARIAIEEGLEVPTASGCMPLTRAVVEMAVQSPASAQERGELVWKKLIAGLKMDGFEIIDVSVSTGREDWMGEPIMETRKELRRMLPNDVPQANFREAESELNLLLDRHGFAVSKGHLFQAISNFSQGSWAGANAQFRSFFESLVQEIAERCRYQENGDHRARVRFLGELSPPFFFEHYNEWKSNDNAPQYLHGLMARLHPQGSHPGLSEEEDCTFRFQIVLVTTRLFLRRFDQGVR